MNAKSYEFYIQNKLGNSFAKTIVLIGIILLSFGVFSLFISPILGLILVLLGGFMATTNYGVQIDIRKSKIRQYGSIYFIKYGKWIELSNYKFVTIISKRIGNQIFFSSNQSFTLTEELYTVCLFGNKMNKKVEIKIFDKKDIAHSYAEKIQEILNIDFIKYVDFINSIKKDRNQPSK